MQVVRGNVIKDKSYAFAIRIIKLCTLLQSLGFGWVAERIINSGTNIGACIERANAGQSKNEFVEMMQQASHQARETAYWLRLIAGAKLIDHSMQNIIQDADELINILSAIVRTGQKNLHHSKQRVVGH